VGLSTRKGNTSDNNHDDDNKKEGQENIESQEEGNIEPQEQEKRKSQKQAELLLTTSAFLGGLTFTAMIFVMQSREDFVYQNFVYYPEIMITCLGGISFVFVLASIGHLDTATHIFSVFGKTHKLSFKFSAIGWICIIILIPFLVLPFTLVGAIVLGAVEIILSVRLLSHGLADSESKKL